MDSTFIDGSDAIYQSGIISDTALLAGETAEYQVKIYVPLNERVQYITRDIHWEVYE